MDDDATLELDNATVTVDAWPENSKSNTMNATYESYKLSLSGPKHTAWQVVAKMKPDKVKTTRKMKTRRKKRQKKKRSAQVYNSPKIFQRTIGVNSSPQLARRLGYPYV